MFLNEQSIMIILLDRDGIINQDSSNYIKSVEEFIFLPGSIDALVQLTQAGYRIGIATNQSGIARGFYDELTLAAIHDHMLTQVRAAGGDIEAIEYCPHHPEQACFCRKPNPGMLLALAKRMNCELTDVPFVGDKISDLQAAKTVGAKPILIAELGSDTDQIRQKEYPEVPRCRSLAQWVESINLEKPIHPTQ
jgi:D-glycero-D-manno-heptose 1,7-bisphosphate phosphatase